MSDVVAEDINHERRSFVGRAMAWAAAPLAMLGSVDAPAKTSRELRAIGEAADWINSPRLTADQLRGKVVLADFCTYTCINWLRTLPYIRAWAHKYAQGLVVIGVHTPEFQFEKNLDNVRRAIAQMGIEYPIVIDSDYAIWRAFRNNYWPALYLIDPGGRVRHRYFGEGEYEQSEAMIQRLLGEAGIAGPNVNGYVRPADARAIEVPADWEYLRSPENYLGYDRTANFASSGGADVNRRKVYTTPSRLALNHWAVNGDWTIANHAAVVHAPSGRLVDRFHARDLHLVIGPAERGASVRVRVTIDGQPPGASHGADIDEAGNGIVRDQRLYQLIRQPKPIVDRHFQIEFLDAGAEAFALTFG